ncbi:M1 family metallopeptidase [Paenibacillus sp. TRM 82003]|nr:M1 family metallopeptidase [Paenibacillus sp. TRM 82003]
MKRIDATWRPTRLALAALAAALALTAIGCEASTPTHAAEAEDAAGSGGIAAPSAGAAVGPGGSLPGEATGAMRDEAPDVAHVAPPEPPLERSAYDIRMRFFPERRLLEGTTTVRARNGADEPTNQVKFNLYLNAFTDEARAEREPVLTEYRKRAYPSGSEEGGIEVDRVAEGERDAVYEVNGTVLTIELGRDWAPGETLELSLDWRATIPRMHHRAGAQDDAFWFGNALPILAVYDGEWRTYGYEPVGDPFFSEAADYRAELTAPSAYTIVATGDESEPVVDDAEGTATTRIEAPKARELAFAASAGHRFVGGETGGGIAVNVYYRHTSASRAKEALTRALEMIDAMEARVGKYPYAEMDLFENEMFVTGMEYPGLAFVRHDRLDSETGYETVVHEIAHQWFYNVIGNNQITEPWLDEAFATYFTDVYMHGAKLDAVYADRAKKLNPNAAVGDVRDYGKWSTYWTANYRKGSLMVHALRKELGEDAFSAFLQDYYRTFRFGIVDETAFRETAQRHAGEPLDDFFAKWLE